MTVAKPVSPESMIEHQYFFEKPTSKFIRKIQNEPKIKMRLQVGHYKGRCKKDG